MGTTPIGRIQVGDDCTGKSYDIAYDDVVSDTIPIPDTTNPSSPPGFTATASATGGVDLSWMPANDDLAVTGYEVYRDGSPLVAVGSSTTTYKDTSTSTSTAYEYKVRAVDAAGNKSAFGTPVTVTTAPPDTTPPSTPGNLAATIVSFNRVDLSWSASTDNLGVTGYKVYRDGNLLQSLTAGTTSYQDLTAAANTSYSYTVKAIDSAGNLSNAAAPP